MIQSTPPNGKEEFSCRSPLNQLTSLSLNSAQSLIRISLIKLRLLWNRESTLSNVKLANVSLSHQLSNTQWRWQLEEINWTSILSQSRETLTTNDMKKNNNMTLKLPTLTVKIWVMSSSSSWMVKIRCATTWSISETFVSQAKQLRKGKNGWRKHLSITNGSSGFQIRQLVK